MLNNWYTITDSYNLHDFENLISYIKPAGIKEKIINLKEIDTVYPINICRIILVRMNYL